MATRFLSDAEIERLESFPEAIDERDLARYFGLDGEDLRFVRRQHSPARRAKRPRRPVPNQLFDTL